MKIHGHRGARGLYPENTIIGFVEAIKMGVDVLEMDVVISGDGLVVVSHEPWMHQDICTLPNGSPISPTEAKDHNLYQMPYETIKQYDCGLLLHPRFEQQQKLPACKPLLSDVIDVCEKYCKLHNLPEVGYNIETKCTPAGDGIYHPNPETFAQLLVDVLIQKNVLNRSFIQSFDIRTLQYLKRKKVAVSMVFLAEYKASVIHYINTLGFTPDVLSPFYKLIDENMVTQCKQNNIALIPWTVNHIGDIEQMYIFGVDAIISDYPHIAIELINKLSKT